jgi:hypothetical protein
MSGRAVKITRRPTHECSSMSEMTLYSTQRCLHVLHLVPANNLAMWRRPLAESILAGTGWWEWILPVFTVSLTAGKMESMMIHLATNSFPSVCLVVRCTHSTAMKRHSQHETRGVSPAGPLLYTHARSHILRPPQIPHISFCTLPVYCDSQHTHYTRNRRDPKYKRYFSTDPLVCTDALAEGRTHAPQELSNKKKELLTGIDGTDALPSGVATIGGAETRIPAGKHEY